jgi:hypothetical protein
MSINWKISICDYYFKKEFDFEVEEIPTLQYYINYLIIKNIFVYFLNDELIHIRKIIFKIHNLVTFAFLRISIRKNNAEIQNQNI